MSNFYKTIKIDDEFGSISIAVDNDSNEIEVSEIDPEYPDEESLLNVFTVKQAREFAHALLRAADSAERNEMGR